MFNGHGTHDLLCIVAMAGSPLIPPLEVRNVSKASQRSRLGELRLEVPFATFGIWCYILKPYQTRFLPTHLYRSNP
ncbi:hypothetical protein PG994_005624 [Apiospora phragmitis]|uniref:Uncharacterized protein n=1 Tax=Apiospora phragmitis TaxID=2905665 RepID=A0ABR1VCU6_9PEZI